MNHRWIQFLFAALFSFATAAAAYEIETHADLSKAAAEASVISAPGGGVLRSLGLQYPIEERIKQVFPNSRGENKSILELIRDGSRFEDLGTRSLNHFYDPLRDRGLFGVNVTSPNWALEDKGAILFPVSQQFSLADSRDSLYRAMTLADEEERKKNFGLTFESLGRMIHHIQDMAQPQHVRNDPHCDAIFPCLIPGGAAGLYNPSLYENYIKGLGGNLPFTGYPTVMFDTARKFWVDSGRGLAEFTNQNFLSARTNFELRADGTVALNTRYPNPASTGPSETVPIQTLLQEDGTCQASGGGSGGECGNECGPPVELPPACGLVGEVVFYGSLVQDNYAGGSVLNERASTLSLFDQDLEAYDKQAEYRLENGQIVAVKKVFTLNRFNFQAAYPHLIPKAVAYSAGLVDFFFRGRIEVLDVSDDDTQLYIDIRNISGTGNGFSNGRFEVYYDTAESGEASRHVG